MNFNVQTGSWLKKLIIGLSLLGGAAVGYWYYQSSRVVSYVSADYTILPYDADRDTQDVINLFKKEWYLLSAREFSYPMMRDVLVTHSPNEYEPRYFGKMLINVMRDKQGVLIGFITYYLMNFKDGRILYLAIDPEFRGKRYAERLMDVAVDYFRKKGAKTVCLWVRVGNERAHKLYYRYGFKNKFEQDGFYHFEKEI